MNTTRTFLIASALARLAAKERGALRVIEGYFSQSGERSLAVHLTSEVASLIVTSTTPGQVGQEAAGIPPAHAEALLDVCAGKIDYLRTTLTHDRASVHLERIVAPGLLDRVRVVFETGDAARKFEPPAWFGPEVSDEQGYQNNMIVLAGVPILPDFELSNGALDSLLDTFENRSLARTRKDMALSNTTPAVSNPAVAATIDPAEADEEAAVSAIEDDVIRELARSLRPRRR